MPGPSPARRSVRPSLGVPFPDEPPLGLVHVEEFPDELLAALAFPAVAVDAFGEVVGEFDFWAMIGRRERPGRRTNGRQSR